MTDVQRTVLHQEAATLHALITPVLWRNSLMNPTNQQ